MLIVLYTYTPHVQVCLCVWAFIDGPELSSKREKNKRAGSMFNLKSVEAHRKSHDSPLNSVNPVGVGLVVVVVEMWWW